MLSVDHPGALTEAEVHPSGYAVVSVRMVSTLSIS